MPEGLVSGLKEPDPNLPNNFQQIDLVQRLVFRDISLFERTFSRCDLSETWGGSGGNCPTLVSGRGAGIRLGENLVLPPPLQPVAHPLQRSGVKVDKHGDSTGPLESVLA